MCRANRRAKGVLYRAKFFDRQTAVGIFVEAHGVFANVGRHHARSLRIPFAAAEFWNREADEIATLTECGGADDRPVRRSNGNLIDHRRVTALRRTVAEREILAVPCNRAGEPDALIDL